MTEACLISGDPMQVWVDYDAATMVLKVAPAPVTATASAPKRMPLLSYHCNLSTVLVLAAGAAVVLLMQ